MSLLETERVDYTAEEMLTRGTFHEPLIANGVRCHGGFDAQGNYCSPRTEFRNPAIAAWQHQLAQGGHGLIDIPREFIPPQYPSAEQSRLLLRHGVREPTVRALTLISIIEGFGATIRDMRIPELRALFVEDINGTALAHLELGLIEAHARDESGYRDEGGHKQMWEAARDMAFENPKIPGDVLMRLMGRRNARGKVEPLFPMIDPKLEQMLGFMSQVLIVEIFAESTFQWGIDVLSDPEVSAAPQTAAQMVSHIQADEKPHVEYLRTALSEARARTIQTVDGREISGRKVIDGIITRAILGMTSTRREEQVKEQNNDLAEQMKNAPNPRALQEEFEALGQPWSAPDPAELSLVPTPRPA